MTDKTITVPRSLLDECSVLAMSYETIARKDPYAGRDPGKDEPRDPEKARDLKERIDSLLRGEG